MSLNLQALHELLKCSKYYNLKYISIKNREFEVVMNRELPKSLMQNLSPVLNYKIQAKQNTSPSQINSITPEKTSHTGNEIDRCYIIVSPMVGTFYRSPGPNEPAFIDLYQQVNQNQTVCIIEAMKLMNEIESEIKGEVVEILVKDGDIVDSGQALIKIRPVSQEQTVF